MLRLHNLSIDQSLIEKLEIGSAIFWLIYFLGKLRLPLPVSSIQPLSYLFIAFLLALHWKRICWISTKDIPLLLLLGLSLASLFWSVSPQSTLNSNRATLRMILFGAYLATRYSIKEQMKLYTWVFGITAILGVIVAGIPGYGYGGSTFVGIFAYKNSLAYCMVLAAITFLLVALEERKSNWLIWILFCLAIFSIIFAKSSAGLVCLLILLPLILLYQIIKLNYKLKAILLCLAFILLGIMVTIVLANMETLLVDILGETAEFNGRTPIWTLVIERLTEERPLLGYGTAAFWKSNAGLFVISNTWAGRDLLVKGSFNFHSSYILILANIGFLGLFLYAISLLTTLIRVIVLLISTKKIEFFWCFQLMIFLLLAGFADQQVCVLTNNSYCTIYVSICLSTAVEWRRIKMGYKRYSNLPS